MTELISRQAALEAIDRAVTKEAARWAVKELPAERSTVMMSVERCACGSDARVLVQTFDKARRRWLYSYECRHCHKRITAENEADALVSWNHTMRGLKGI